jgi:DNA-binding transcriptional LysR family regulator
MTCATGIVRMALDSLIPELLARHPRLDVEVTTTSRYVDLVEEGYDLALRSHTTPLQDSSLVARQLAQTRVLLVASPRMFPQGFPQDPAALENASGVQLARSGATNAWHLHADDGRSATVPFRPRLRCNDAPLARRAALEGLGVAALPSPLCRRDLVEGTLVRVLPDWHIRAGTLSLVVASPRGMSRAVRATKDFLVEALPRYLQD